MLQIKIFISLKANVLDPQGTIIKNALHNLKFNNVEDVRIGKYIEMKLNTSDKEAAEKQIKEMCQKLLANPIIEDFSFKIL